MKCFKIQELVLLAIANSQSLIELEIVGTNEQLTFAFRYFTLPEGCFFLFVCLFESLDNQRSV